MVSSIKKRTCGNNTTLVKYLKDLTDVRSASGKRYELYEVLVIALMAIMNQVLSFRGFEDYAKCNHKKICNVLGVERERLPCKDTFRRVFKNLIFEELNSIIQMVVKDEISPTQKEWISLDGKRIKHTLPEKDGIFVNILSAFSHNKKLVLGNESVPENTNEIPIARKLIKQLKLKNKVYIIDAMHTQQATIDTIIDSGNSYVLCVKDNQETLKNKVAFQINLTEKNKTLNEYIEKEKNRGRQEIRKIKVTKNELVKDFETMGWREVKTLIRVERKITRANLKQTYEKVYFISNLEEEPKEFAKGIRNHWTIENSLHYVKDVVLNEDASCVKITEIAENFSVLRSLALNIMRISGFEEIRSGSRLLMCNIRKMWKLLGGGS